MIYFRGYDSLILIIFIFTPKKNRVKIILSNKSYIFASKLIRNLKSFLCQHFVFKL